MTLITKEDKDSYNSVITNVNQKISVLLGELEKLISESESNAADEEDSFNTLIKKANNLKTYVSGLLTINKQLDAQMPDSCNYEWVYTETEYNCAESSDCGEDCGDGCEDCSNDCTVYCSNECTFEDCSNCTFDCMDDCDYCAYDCNDNDCGDACSDNCTFESCNEDCGEGSCTFE
jgi:hypothetical protein